MRPPAGPSGLYRLVTRPGGPAPAAPASAGLASGGRASGGLGSDGLGSDGQCQLCAEPIPAGHRHLLDLDAHRLCCACRACAVLFDSPAPAGGQRYRLIPDRRWYLPGFVLDDAAWAGLRLPVEMAFFFHDTRAGRVVAFYPSPAGAVESLLDLDCWQGLTAANPVLDTLLPDVEALLVNRARGARDHWLVPVDDCYALVGLIRAHWSGLSGGARVWTELAAYFADLRARARTPDPAARPTAIAGSPTAGSAIAASTTAASMAAGPTTGGSTTTSAVTGAATMNGSATAAAATPAATAATTAAVTGAATAAGTKGEAG